jgi:hypothetical protein
VAFVGGSLSRYQYMNFAYFMAHRQHMQVSFCVVWCRIVWFGAGILVCECTGKVWGVAPAVYQYTDFAYFVAHRQHMQVSKSIQ